jgi:hypothetical protein
VDHSHPRVTRVNRVTLESVENRGSVKIREGSAKSAVKVIIIRTHSVNNQYQQSYIYIHIYSPWADAGSHVKMDVAI